MDTRNVQRTGDMFYVYLPTRWCKKFGISGTSKVGIQVNTDGSLVVYPQASTQKPIHLKLSTKGEDISVLHKLIVASYVSPADSFQITLDKDVDFTKILSQKNLVSLELVEIDGNQITCESSIQISDPLSLLTTMIRKVKNLLRVMEKGSHQELLERYEEEIDRSKLLIEKAVVSSLVNPTKSKHKAIELHFISLVSKYLETMVDHLISLQKDSAASIKRMSTLLSELLSLLQENAAQLTYNSTLLFVQSVSKLPDVNVKDVTSYDKRRIVRSFNNISEVMIDWAVIRETEVQTS